MFRYPSMYEPLALDAAKFIIEERLAGSASEPVPIKINSKHQNKENPTNKVFQTKFLRAFSFRDIYSAIMVALLYMAINNLLDYYNDEEWLEDKWYSKDIIYLILSIPLIHILYKKEHRRSNDFIGRCFHMTLFLFAFMILESARDFILYQSIASVLQGISIIFLPFMLAVLAIFMELFFSVIKRLFYLFKWRIW